MNEKIITGLKSLDTKTDAQWTQEGLVNLNAFKFVIGGESVSREQLEEVAPGFTRENAATYFEEKKESATDKIEQIETELKNADYSTLSGNVDTKQSVMTVDVNVSLADGLKALLKVGQLISLDEISPEDLSKIMENVPERRNELIRIREEFNALLAAEFDLLIKIEEKHELNSPKENHADLVKRIHMANVGTDFVVNQARQRLAQPVPPLVRK